MHRPVSFRDAFPIFATADLDRSLAFYQGLLGFTVTYRWPVDGSIAFAFLTLGSSGLGLGRRGDRHAYTGNTYATDGVSAVDFCLYVNNLIQAIAFLAERQVPILTQPATQPWGEQIAYVADPDGNHVLLIEPPASPANPA